MTTTTITRKTTGPLVDSGFICSSHSDRNVRYHLGLLARRLTFRKLITCGEDYRCSCRGTEHDPRVLILWAAKAS